MLTDLDVRRATGREKPYKLTDAQGLHLYVTPAGTRSWRFKYRFGGQERRIVFGTYPDIGLRRAREMRDDARQALRQGRDPGLETKRARHARRHGFENTFEKFAREWHEQMKDGWKPVHSDDVIGSMEKDLFPVIGGFPVDQIDESLLLAALRVVERRGAIETAHRLRQRAERVFRYAAGAGSPNANPAVNVKDSMKSVPPKRRWPAVTRIEDVRRVIDTSDRAAASPVTKLASRFLALTAQRPGMVRSARWEEIEGVDWADPQADSPDALWRISADRMKQELELREDEGFEHVVPLAPAAVAVLRAVRALSGRSPLIFPSTRDALTPMSMNAIGYLYNREGWKGRHVPHGWRSSFSTIMNGRAERLYPGADRLVIDRLVIDLMLAHLPSGMSATEFRYNRQGYMERRREIAQDWAELALEGAVPVTSIIQGPRRRKAP